MTSGQGKSEHREEEQSTSVTFVNHEWQRRFKTYVERELFFHDEDSADALEVMLMAPPPPPPPAPPPAPPPPASPADP